MLKTPFGSIVVEINGSPIDYSIEELPLSIGSEPDELLFKVDARYKIIPNIAFDSVPFRLNCYAQCEDDSFIDREISGLETGEMLWLTSMYAENIKMSIGAYDEIDGIEPFGSTLTGVEIYISSKICFKYAYFCVAWITLDGNDYETNGDIYTWFAADPTIA